MTAPPGLSAVLRPSLILPVLLSAALLLVALGLGDLGAVLARVQTLPLWVLAFALGMAAVYLLIKGWQLHLLLQGADLHPGWRRLLLAFAVGELALTLPLGIFAQNWMLAVTGQGRAQFGRSSSATVVMLLLETLVVLLALASIGIPAWPALQPITILLALGLLTFAYLVLRFGHLATRLPQPARSQLLRTLLAQWQAFASGLHRIYQPRVLLLALVSSAGYLLALAIAFTLVGRNMGLADLDLTTAITIYAFSLAVVLMLGGVLSQIGLVEVLGISAAQAWGMSLTDGLALMLGFRLVWTGAMWLLNLPLILFLWRKVQAPDKI